ncbi:MAG: hypothetical protein ABW046_23415 [Actinoplanes sp.]
MTLQIVQPPAPVDPSAAEQPRSEPPITTTRYLSVGAYVDTRFRDRCLRDVYHQSRRFVAPSYGFDLVTVLWHCLRARRLTICRDALIVLALAVTAYLDWRAIAAVTTALIAMRTSPAAKSAIGEYLTREWKEARSFPVRASRRDVAVITGCAVAWLLLIVLTALVFVSGPLPIAGLPGSGAASAIPAIIAVIALPTLFTLWREMRVQSFAPTDRLPPSGDNSRLRDIAAQQSRNTIVYSDFEPFIGAGDVFATAGFPVRLVRKDPEATETDGLTEGEREFETPPFTAEEIIGYVREHLRRLTDGEAETRIPDLTVEDRIFLSAREGGERALVTDPERIREIIRNPTEPARYYLVCQVVSWGGELVTTVHVHIAVQGRSLYLELTTTWMAPCNERYRIVDLEGGQGPRAWLRALVDGVRETPATVLHSPGTLLRALLDLAGFHELRRRRSRRAADRGPLMSVRQLGTEDRLRNFTQRQDVLKFRRLIENRVYAHVLDFLDEHDVDTTEFRTRSASILNIGMVNNGEATVNGDVAGTSTTTTEPTES